jgi:hypothetical protein
LWAYYWDVNWFEGKWAWLRWNYVRGGDRARNSGVAMKKVMEQKRLREWRSHIKGNKRMRSGGIIVARV